MPGLRLVAGGHLATSVVDALRLWWPAHRRLEPRRAPLSVLLGGLM
jgi:hypothetical protein